MSPQTDHAQIEASQVDDGSSTTELIARYRRGPALLREAVAGMSRGELLARPIEGKLSTLEVVCHVADAEQFLADRLKRIIAMDRPLLVGSDGWLYFEALHYMERDIDLDLSLVDATRAQMAADLDRIDDEAWERVAIHTETGLVSLRQMLLHTIRHVEWHIETIAEKRAALGD